MNMTIRELVNEFKRQMEAIGAVIDDASLQPLEDDDYLVIVSPTEVGFSKYMAEGPVLMRLRRGSSHQVLEAADLEHRLAVAMRTFVGTIRNAIPSRDSTELSIWIEIRRSPFGHLRAELRIDDVYLLRKPAALLTVATALATRAELPA